MAGDETDIGGEDLDPVEAEAAIERMVRRFYAGWRDDPLLAPILAALPDLEAHLTVIVDFWSRQLLRTERYQGSPFAPHWRLDIEPEHFAHWLALFEQAAGEELPAALAGPAIDKARHMAVAFQAGLFPIRGPDGRPMRLTPRT